MSIGGKEKRAYGKSGRIGIVRTENNREMFSGHTGKVERPEEQWVQRNSAHRGRVSTEEQWAQRNNEYRRTVGTEEQCAQRNNWHRGTMSTVLQWGQRNSEDRGKVGTEE